MRRKIISLLVAVCLFSGITAQAADTQERLDALRPGLEQLKSLLDECEEAGIDTGYEQVDYGVIRDFIEYGKQDISWGDTDRAAYVADTLERLYQDVSEKLAAYKNGSDSPKNVVRNKSQNYGGTLNGDFINKYGNPIISNGFGVFEQLKNDIPKMQEFGADLVQIEIGPSSVIVPKGSVNGWGSTVYGNAQATADVVENAGRSGNYGLKIVNKTAASPGAYLTINQNVSVKPNTTYTLTFYAKTKNSSNFSYGMQGWTAPRNYINSGTQPWREYSTSYTTGEEEYNLEILFVSSGKADEIYIDDISIQEDGKNIIQNGDFEDTCMYTSENFQAKTSAIRDKVVRVLDNAEKNDVMVNVLISPHYFPDWVLEEYPQAKQTDCGLGYNINDPIVQEALELYIEALMNEIKDHHALHSICLTNEPKCITRNQEALLSEYADYLEEVHGSISTLNSIYGTKYRTFSDVPMPASDTMDAAYYDWVQFNNRYTANWHRYLSDLVKKYAPDVATHAKIMTIFGNSDSLNYGVDPEDLAEFTDYNGNDAWGFYGKDASGLISKLAWYDLLRSIKPKAPVINSEDHIIEDRNSNYTDKQAIHVAADTWQGAVHGRDASIIWIWGRTKNSNAATYGNILYRPDVLSAVGKKSLDLNRLSKQISDLQKAESKVSILYSPTSRAYSSNTVKSLLYAYETSLYAGANPKFITEKQLAGGIVPEGVLILPETKNIPQEAYDAILAYSKSGGKIIALGENCLAYDEYNRTRTVVINFDQTLLIERKGTAITKPEKTTLQQQIIDVANISDSLVNKEGELVTGVEKIAANTSSGHIWNLCNYTWDTSKKICFDGNAVDLLTGIIYEGEIELKPFTPVLLDFDGLTEASIIASAYQRGHGSGYHTIFLKLKNQGDLHDFSDVSLKIRNEATGEIIEGIHFSKYLSGHSEETVQYTFAVSEGTYKAIINGRYDDRKKQIPQLQISIE